jgi:AcrR family transcriptional regulator
MTAVRKPTWRRDQLLAATLDAIRERGIGNLRVQDVAERAGVSTGTVHYHFSDIDQLILDVFTWACDRFYAQRLEVIAAISDAREQLVAMIASGLPEDADDALVVALYDIGVYRRGSAPFAPLAQALFDRQVALYFAVLQLGVAQGHFRLAGPIVDIAQNLVALEDAYGLHIVSGNRSVPPERARQLILDSARMVTDCPDLDFPA